MELWGKGEHDTQTEDAAMIGHLTQTTNNGTVCRGTEAVRFQHDDVARWGVFVAYGTRNGYLSAELTDGRRVAILESIQEAAERAWVRDKKRSLRYDGIAAAALRRSRSAGILWETTQP